MELTLHTQQVNRLLQRTELEGTLAFEGATPSNTDVAAEIARSLRSDPALIVVRKIDTLFGHQAAKVHARVYQTLDARKKYETVASHLKKQAKQQKADAAKAAGAEKAAAKPAAPSG